MEHETLISVRGVGVRFVRYHGLGNDYLVADEVGDFLPAWAVPVCDRHRGIGGDGVLVPFATQEADFGVHIVNPDGSIAEKSGNGLRIFARWLVDTGRAASPTFTVWTGFERVSCWVRDTDITIEMGRARFEPADVGLTINAPLVASSIPDFPHPVTAVSIGNPHAVVFVDHADLDTLPWRAWGEQLETHPLFSNRTNVQIATCTPAGLAVRIWERGAGATLASGSSAVAATAAAVRTGRLQPGTHRVFMQGGELEVVVREDATTRLRGPVERVGVCVPDPAWCAARGLR